MRTTKFPFVQYVVFRTVFHPTEQKLRNFKNLGKGWHYGEGDEIAQNAIEEAFQLHREIIVNGFYKTDVFPGLGGEIQTTIYAEDNYFAFERERSGMWSLTHERNDEEI